MRRISSYTIIATNILYPLTYYGTPIGIFINYIEYNIRSHLCVDYFGDTLNCIAYKKHSKKYTLNYASNILACIVIRDYFEITQVVNSIQVADSWYVFKHNT